MLEYQQTSMQALHDTLYGVGFHWTTWTVSKSGTIKPFGEAVQDFDVENFVKQVADTGAGHLMFTVTHALHWLPGPNEEVDRIIKGRTCKRDLIMEIADGLLAKGIKLLLYYNHGTCPKQDPDWQDAVGSTLYNKQAYFNNYCRILRWMGNHYGKKVFAYWLDSATAFTDDPDTPWMEMTMAAKAGNPDRLICYNTGIEEHKLATPYQDYWAGEVTRLNYYPRGELTPAGLPWYALISWHPHLTRRIVGEWGISGDNFNAEWLKPSVDSVVTFIRRFYAHGGAVTCNLLCYQDGNILTHDLEVMREVKKIIRGI